MHERNPTIILFPELCAVTQVNRGYARLSPLAIDEPRFILRLAKDECMGEAGLAAEGR